MEDDQSRSSASVSDREMRSAEGVGSIEWENQSRTSTSMADRGMEATESILRMQWKMTKVDHLRQ